MIDRDESRLAQARAGVRRDASSHGDATEPSLLERSGIRAADVVVAVTGHDEDNLVVANLAKFEFEVPHVVARVKNALNAWLYEPDMGVDVLVSAPHTIAQLIEEQVAVGDVVQLLELAHGQAALLEATLPEHSPLRRAARARGRVAPRLRRRGCDPRHPRAASAGRARVRGRRPRAVRHGRRADGAAAPPVRHDAAPPLRLRGLPQSHRVPTRSCRKPASATLVT